MRFHSKIVAVFGVAAIAYASIPAGAQPEGASGIGATNPAADGQVSFQVKANVAPQELNDEAERTVTRVTQSATVIRRQLEQARGQRDVVKVLCLNDKLSQVDVAARSARERRAALQAALSRNENDLAMHEFSILTVLRQRSEQLGAEANLCIGEEAAVLGEAKILVAVDPVLAGADPSTVTGGGVPVPGDPTSATFTGSGSTTSTPTSPTTSGGGSGGAAVITEPPPPPYVASPTGV